MQTVYLDFTRKIAQTDISFRAWRSLFLVKSFGHNPKKTFIYLFFHLFFILGRVRDVLSNAKRMLRESAETAETEQVKEKMEDLKETMESVIQLSNDRLDILEQALPLAEHFYETHNELSHWLDEMDQETMNQLNPGSNPDQIAKQQEINRSLMQSVQDHKPVLDRLNKTGGALLRLIIEDDAYRVQDIIETDNQR